MASNTTATQGGPALSVTGVTKAHAQRAIRWMRARSLPAWFRPEDHSLNAFEFKHGAAWTDKVMRQALAETRNGANYIPAPRDVTHVTAMLDRAQLETVFRALQEAHGYIAHPDAIRPCASKRVATHRVPNHHFVVMERNCREALKVLNDILHADPVPT